LATGTGTVSVTFVAEIVGDVYVRRERGTQVMSGAPLSINLRHEPAACISYVCLAFFRTLFGRVRQLTRP
jgi:hypothetical protein